MKIIKGIGFFFTIVGIFLFIVGIAKLVVEFNKKDERIYTHATISKIEEYNDNDLEDGIDYRVYVKFNVNNQTIISMLNTYGNTYQIGDEIEIYYYNDNRDLVYKEGSEKLLIIFPVVGSLVSILGILLISNKNLQNFLIKQPSCEL